MEKASRDGVKHDCLCRESVLALDGRNHVDVLVQDVREWRRGECLCNQFEQGKELGVGTNACNCFQCVVRTKCLDDLHDEWVQCELDGGVNLVKKTVRCFALLQGVAFVSQDGVQQRRSPRVSKVGQNFWVLSKGKNMVGDKGARYLLAYMGNRRKFS